MKGDTVVACLTPEATGAIATLAVDGPEAWNVCRALFTPRKGTLPERPEEVSRESFYFGHFGETLRDEVVLALIQATPVQRVELHGHGGRQMVAVLLETLANRGVRVLDWRAWCDRVESSSIRAEALKQLALAPTARTANILLDQYHGAFESALQAIREGTLTVESVTRFAEVGRHLVTPWRVVVAGEPNVGKSSLVNALAGFQRAIVSETPGTTRDVVTTRIALDGWPIELADTAGQREEASPLEEAGIRLAREESSRADLTLWVTDAAFPPSRMPDGDALHVVNKIDLPATWNFEGLGAVRVSARTGQGLPELCERIVRRLVKEAPTPGAAVPFSKECWDRLRAMTG
jgi:tRNA modification GTPase